MRFRARACVCVPACVCVCVCVFMVFFHFVSEENKLLYMEVSALDATNVNVAFETLFNGKQPQRLAL